ncbi:hypothetical protein CK203_037210 [Vitis vinifera]|uniref:Uncharacterized protein n=1 Tax=Vitis vinifera TaxID=29760 RepID=A0A438HS12_VITVI|nr:hypothetical protein CK203_037210 [Vitis vinifera]
MMINKDKRIIVVKDMVRDVVIKDMESTCQPPTTNSEACISLTSTTKKENSFVLYTLRIPSILSPCHMP